MTPAWRVVLERVLLVALGVALDTLSMPPGPAPALAFAADAPFLWLLWHRGGRRWWLWAWLFGFARIAVGVRWLGAVHSLFPLAPGLFLGWIYVVAGFAIRWAVRRRAPYLLVVPLVAVLEEMARTVLFGGMPWPARSLALTAWQPFVGFASIFGAYGLSFLAALASAWVSGIPALLRRESRGLVLGPWIARGVLVAATIGVAAVRGGLRASAFDDRQTAGDVTVTSPVVVVQGNIPQWLKNSRDDDDNAPNRIFDRHTRLTEEALAATPGALAVVWPETMIPWAFVSPELALRFPDVWENELTVIRRLKQAGAAVPGARFIVGAPYYFVGRTGHHEHLRDDDSMDSVFLVDPVRVPDEGPVVVHPEIPAWRPPWELGRHDKVILVPGGEYTPGGDLFPPLRAFKDYMSPIPELTAGSRDVAPFLLDTQPPPRRREGTHNREVKAGTANCFEIAFPAFCRSWRQRGATVLMNIANYGWFGDSEMPAQVMALARLRASETGMTVLVAGNTGPTAAIDPAGRVRSQLSVAGRTQFVEGWLATPLWSDEYETAYLGWGDVPWFVLAGAVVVLSLWRRRPRTEGHAPASPPAGPDPGAGPEAVVATEPRDGR